MVHDANPALAQFVAMLSGELVLAEVLITRVERRFELRHVRDRASPAEALSLIPLPELRPLAQLTAAGAFRPLKAAPNLRQGWRAVAATAEELGIALNDLYPGGLADWYAVQVGPPPVTHYRECTSRQTGMYRLTQLLSEEQAACVTAACCHPGFCLKQRLWTVASLGPDPPQEKSLIPCLEPCAVFLEFARKAMRLEQETAAPLDLTPGERSTLQCALETALRHPADLAREADFNLPSNPRRMAFLLEKLKRFQPAHRQGK
jgi:hypothetical protein